MRFNEPRVFEPHKAIKSTLVHAETNRGGGPMCPYIANRETIEMSQSITTIKQIPHCSAKTVVAPD